MILNALEGRPLPVYGRGENVRDWLHVEDHVEALWTVLGYGRAGDTYCIGGESEHRNMDVVISICRIMDELEPWEGGAREQLITLVEDRPGHDARYAMDAEKIRRELGWTPRYAFESGLHDTVRWYLENREWWQRVRSGAYRGERLGLAATAMSTMNNPGYGTGGTMSPGSSQ